MVSIIPRDFKASYHPGCYQLHLHHPHHLGLWIQVHPLLHPKGKTHTERYEACSLHIQCIVTYLLMNSSFQQLY